MSDLISRNKLLESFRKSYCGHLGMENSDGMITFRSICRIINEQPTSYDVDRVVEELEERSKEYNSGLRLHGKPEEMCTDEAIEIVKQGGVDDDVRQYLYAERLGEILRC